MALEKLQQFRKLSTAQKRQLYPTMVRSKLTYPPIPMNAISKHQLSIMQRIQTKASRLVPNTPRTECVTRERPHVMADLEPLNKYLQTQTDNIWNKIQSNYQETYEILKVRVPENHKYFPSSVLKHAVNEPPFYG